MNSFSDERGSYDNEKIKRKVNSWVSSLAH